MKKILALTGCIFIILLAFGYLLFFEIREKPMQEIVSENQVAVEKYAKITENDTSAVEKDTTRTPSPIKKSKNDELKSAGMAQPKPAEEVVAPQVTDDTDSIQHIKQEIYSRDIEYVEQIGMLDELVQTGDADTREFWGSDWTSVDDWKKNSNGFSLEKNNDGTLIFSPDEQTARQYTFFQNPLSYSYDAENREFVNEVDYYGKTIYNVAKFINDNVLVMMTISGRKVDLNIYQKNAARE